MIKLLHSNVFRPLSIGCSLMMFLSRYSSFGWCFGSGIDFGLLDGLISQLCCDCFERKFRFWNFSLSGFNEAQDDQFLP